MAFIVEHVEWCDGGYGDSFTTTVSRFGPFDTKEEATAWAEAYAAKSWAKQEWNEEVKAPEFPTLEMPCNEDGWWPESGGCPHESCLSVKELILTDPNAA